MKKGFYKVSFAVLAALIATEAGAIVAPQPAARGQTAGRGNDRVFTTGNHNGHIQIRPPSGTSSGGRGGGGGVNYTEVVIPSGKLFQDTLITLNAGDSKTISSILTASGIALADKYKLRYWLSEYRTFTGEDTIDLSCGVTVTLGDKEGTITVPAAMSASCVDAANAARRDGLAIWEGTRFDANGNIISNALPGGFKTGIRFTYTGGIQVPDSTVGVSGSHLQEVFRNCRGLADGAEGKKTLVDGLTITGAAVATAGGVANIITAGVNIAANSNAQHEAANLTPAQISQIDRDILPFDQQLSRMSREVTLEDGDNKVVVQGYATQVIQMLNTGHCTNRVLPSNQYNAEKDSATDKAQAQAAISTINSGAIREARNCLVEKVRAENSRTAAKSGAKGQNVAMVSGIASTIGGGTALAGGIIGAGESRRMIKAMEACQSAVNNLYDSVGELTVTTTTTFAPKTP